METGMHVSAANRRSVLGKAEKAVGNVQRNELMW